MNFSNHAFRPLLVSSALTVVLTLAGCASTRIATALEDYGVPPTEARCVGQNLSDRLSVSQLSAMSRAASAYKDAAKGGVALTILDLARAAAEIRDPVIPIEIMRAAVVCSVPIRGQ